MILSRAAVAALWLCTAVAGAHTITNEDLRHVRGLSDPRLSPDGTRVLVAVSESTADGGASHLWLIDAAHDSSRQISFSPESDKAGEKHARWLGNGDILFLAKRGALTRLYRLPMAGGEASPFDLKVAPPADASTAPEALPPRKPDAAANRDPLPLEVTDFECSADGHTVALLAADPETPGEKKQKEEKADALWVDHDLHGKRLYLLDTGSGALRAVAIAPDVARALFDRSGARLMVLTEPTNGAGDLQPANRAFLVSVQDPAHPAAIAELPPTVDDGAFSDDGTRFYFRAQSAQDVPPGYQDLYAMDLKTRRVDTLTADFTGSLGGGRLLVTGAEVLHAAQSGTQLGYVRFARGRLERVAFASPVVSALDADSQRTRWVWLGQGSDAPAALFVGARPGVGTRLASTPAILPHPFAPVTLQHVRWSNEDLALEGLLWMPPAATGKVPLIVDVHGGPTGAWDERFEPMVHLLLAQGWAVFRPNIRGSTGYGARFAAANKNDLGGADYRDLMSGVDHLLATQQLDAARMALIGYSYGGEMAGFVEGKTERFRAVVSGAPVIDQQSEYGTEAGSWYDRWFYGKPWEHAQDAWRQSPLSLAARARSPFLLIQGEADHVDPLGQSLQMYRALRQAGVHVELVQYPREDHGPLSDGMRGYPSLEPWHGFDARQRLTRFISEAFAAPGPAG